MLFNSELDATEIEKEKGVIVEELRMYEDNPTMAIDNLFERTIFGDCPLGWDVGGSAETVRGVSREELWNYYKSAYRPGNMVLVVAGDIKSAQLKKGLKYFTQAATGPAISIPTKSGEKSSLGPNSYQKFIWPTAKLPLEQRVAVKEKNTDQAHLILGFPGLPHNHPDRYVLPVLLNILGGTMSSRLFVEVREKRGLAYMVRANAGAYRDVGVVQIQAGLDPARLGEALSVVKEELQKITAAKVSAKELTDAKSNLSGRMILGMEDSSAVADWWAKQFWFAKQPENFEQVLRHMKKVTAADIARVAKKIFDWSELRLAVIGPVKKEEVLKCL